MPGSGSVFRLGNGKWAAQISTGGRNQRRTRRLQADTQRGALELLERLRSEQKAGVLPSRATVSVFLEQWVRDARNLRPNTRHGYQAVIDYHLIPTIGDVKLASLTPLQVEHALAVLSERMSPKSLRNAHAVLRRALGQAVRAGLLTRNVASREFIDAPRVPVQEPRALSSEEVERLLVAASGDRLEALFLVAIGTGMRQGEILGLAWEDVDFEKSRLHVRRELVRRNGKYQRAELKTPRSRRIVPLAEPVFEALRAHREQVIADGFIPTATGPVFINGKGGPLNGSWVTHRFYAALQRAGIPRLPFKNLRTTFSSRLFEAGISDRIIADMLGHSRVSTTQGHYIATTAQLQGPAVAVVDSMLTHRFSHGPMVQDGTESSARG